MTIDHYFISFYLQTVLSAIVAFACFYNFKKKEASTRLIGLLFLFSFLCNSTAYISVIFLDSNPNFATSIYNVVLIIIITALYDHNTEKKYSKQFFAAGLAVIAFGIINILFLQKDDVSFNSLISSLLILGYCLFYFYRLIIELPAANVLRLPMFWFTSGFLFFHAGTLFLFAFRDYLVNVLQNDLVTYWSFHNIVSILQHIIVLLGLSYDIKMNRTRHHIPH